MYLEIKCEFYYNGMSSDRNEFLDLILNTPNFNWNGKNKEQAVENLLYYLINYCNIEDSIKKALLHGKKDTIIYDFTFNDSVKFGKFYSYYLFMNSDILSMFQSYLDEKYNFYFKAYFIELSWKKKKYGVILKWGEKRGKFLLEEISQHIPVPITYIKYVPSNEDMDYQDRRNLALSKCQASREELDEESSEVSSDGSDEGSNEESETKVSLLAEDLKN